MGKEELTYRIIVFDAANTILDIYEFKARERKDGMSKPLTDQLWIAFEIKPEGGRVEVDKFMS